LASACLPDKKRAEILNSPSTSACLPVKKRAENFQNSSTSVCLPAKKRVWVPHLLSPTKCKTQAQDADSPSEAKVQINDGHVSNSVPVKKRILAPNPLLAIQDVTAKNRVWMEHQLTPALLEIKEENTKLKPPQEKHEVKTNEVKESHEIPTKKQISASNLSSAPFQITSKKRVLMEKPLAPALLGNGGEVTNLKSVQEKDQTRIRAQGKENCCPALKKQVWDLNLLPLANMQNQVKCTDLKNIKGKDHVIVGKTIQEATTKKRARGVHLLSPIAEEKAQTEYLTNRAKEVSSVLAKRRIWAPEPLDPITTQIKQHTDLKSGKHGAENEFQIKDEDKIKGVLSMQVCAMQPSSPTKIETQNEEKSPESTEEEIDDGVLCAVCQSTDGDPSDPIVFCDGCDLMVHASCYGNPLIKSIPEGDWFCSVCSSKSPQKKKKCCLCPSRGGALKPTVDGKWAHVMCALLVPEVFFRDPEGRDGIDCSSVPCKRWQKDCFICGRNHGCAIDCAESKCKLGFHVSCGLEEGLCIEYREGKGADIVAGFCTEHTKLWQKVI
jgi:NuA3 HAT complex component NTO1